MAYDGVPRYVTYPETRFDSNGRPYYELAPVTFRQPPFYDDVYYRRDFRHQHPVGDAERRHGGTIVPDFERVYVRSEDPNPSAAWWHHPDHPHGGHDGHRIFVADPDWRRATTASPHATTTTTVEFHVPQLCCDNCERRVVECLTHNLGVDHVSADQWEKKVVVEGRRLRSESLLGQLRRDLHMRRSVLWEDRPR